MHRVLRSIITKMCSFIYSIQIIVSQHSNVHLAECWSGPSPAADTEYDKHGPGEECFDPEYQKCAKDSPNCVGDESYNFVYKIRESARTGNLFVIKNF